MSDERTVLAYLRTAAAFFGLGAFLLKFDDSLHGTILALASLGFGSVIFVYGIVRYSKYKDKIVKS